MQFEALQRSCKYSYPTNQKDYCGPTNAHTFFYEFIQKPSKEKATKIKSLIRGFPILYAYYDFLSEQTGLEPFDKKIINHYWLAEDLIELDLEKAKDFVLNVLGSRGLPKTRANEITKKLSGNTRLDHFFHVLQVKFVTDKVEKSFENFSRCVVLPARVTKIKRNALLVNSFELDKTGVLEKEKIVLNPFGMKLKKNDFVSLHWENAIEKISKNQANKLEKRLLELL